jgi:SAM-dependent methyltransferase
VLELAAGEGRVALPLARAGMRVTAVDSSQAMLDVFAGRLTEEPAELRGRVELVQQDIRRLQLDRLFRFIYLPFNTLLLMVRPQDRYALLERVREHLAPSGAFAFDIFTPDPTRLVEEPDWVTEIDIEAPHPEGAVHVLRERRRTFDLAEQYMHASWRHTISREGAVIERWESELDIAFVFPRELELLLERQGFKIKARYGGPDGSPYAPTLADVRPMFVVAQIAP